MDQHLSYNANFEFTTSLVGLSNSALFHRTFVFPLVSISHTVTPLTTTARTPEIATEATLEMAPLAPRVIFTCGDIWALQSARDTCVRPTTQHCSSALNKLERCTPPTPCRVNIRLTELLEYLRCILAYKVTCGRREIEKVWTYVLSTLTINLSS